MITIFHKQAHGVAEQQIDQDMEKSRCIDSISGLIESFTVNVHFDTAAMTLGIHLNEFVHILINVRGTRGQGKRRRGKRGRGRRERGKRGQGRRGRASGSETCGTVAVEPYKTTPLYYVSAWHVHLGRKWQRSYRHVGHGCVHRQRISRVDIIQGRNT
jgi:hypothetical protein